MKHAFEISIEKLFDENAAQKAAHPSEEHLSGKHLSEDDPSEGHPPEEPAGNADADTPHHASGEQASDAAPGCHQMMQQGPGTFYRLPHGLFACSVNAAATALLLQEANGIRLNAMADDGFLPSLPDMIHPASLCFLAAGYGISLLLIIQALRSKRS